MNTSAKVTTAIETKTSAPFDFEAAAASVKTLISDAAVLRLEAVSIENQAAVILIAAKDACAHGEYGVWLDANDIARTTAARIVREFKNPEKKAERIAKNKNTPSAKAAKAASAASGDPEDTLRTEVLRIVGGLDADAIAAVYGFLVAQGMTDGADDGEEELEAAA